MATTRLVYRPDHADRAVRDLPSQFRDKPRFRAFVRALAKPFQMLEDALFAIIMDRNVNNASGATLDQLGALVGADRGTLTDRIYRRFIRARIAAYRARSMDDYVTVWRWLLGDPMSVNLRPMYPATFILEGVVSGFMPDNAASATAALLADVKPGGVAMVAIECEPAYFAPDEEGHGCDEGHLSRQIL